MTMDVHSRVGGNVYQTGTVIWTQFADLCFAIAPEVSATCQYWYTNDGDGLGSKETDMLVAILERRLRNGTIDAYIILKTASAEGLPDETCKYCHGTGVRADAVGVRLGFSSKPIQDPDHSRHGQSGWCNACDGKGHLRPFDSHYHLTKQIVEDITFFLKTSGGFQIW